MLFYFTPWIGSNWNDKLQNSAKVDQIKLLLNWHENLNFCKYFSAILLTCESHSKWTKIKATDNTCLSTALHAIFQIPNLKSHRIATLVQANRPCKSDLRLKSNFSLTGDVAQLHAEAAAPDGKAGAQPRPLSTRRCLQVIFGTTRI
jgi:hypothetical protein